MEEPDIGRDAEEYLAILRDDRIEGERAAAFYLGVLSSNIDEEVAVEITCSWVQAIAIGPLDEDNQEWRE